VRSDLVCGDVMRASLLVLFTVTFCANSWAQGTDQAASLITRIGPSAGEFLENAPSSVAAGSSAGRYARNANHSVFLGGSAGYEAKDVNYSVFAGYAAGRFAKSNTYSVLIGYAPGDHADNSNYSVMIGAMSGLRAREAPEAILIGREAGLDAERAPTSIMIGARAGWSARGATNSVFIGNGAGKSASGSTDVVLIGNGADADAGIVNAIGIGRGARPVQNNSWHIPEAVDVGVGTALPTAQLHTTKSLRFQGLKNGVLVTDGEGNVSASALLAEALKEIESLKARVAELEKR
jgi:hypothetical protein